MLVFHWPARRYRLFDFEQPFLEERRQNMDRETKFLHLKTPAMLGERINGLVS
jgi:hypothetical protein